jgi:mannitol 2-dehydrogenase
VCAAWARYALGIDEQGQPITVVDRLLESVADAAAAAEGSPAEFLGRTGVFGDLADEARFVDAFTQHMRALHAGGARAAVSSLVDS